MEAAGYRLRPLLRSLIYSSSSLPQLQAHSLFSSSSDGITCRSRPSFLVFPEEQSTGSAVYRHTLKTQRPLSIRWQKKLENSANFIGRVTSPVKTLTTRSGMLVAYTHLKVEFPSGSNKFFTILLDMWNDMAEVSIQHLKLNDYIYVSGYLQSYQNTSGYGNSILYKVIVKEINYVADNKQKVSYVVEPEESAVEKRRKRLHLWQVFFTSPHEWRDLRKCKTNPKQPDFKHKATDEALWLKPNDPPWISRQLQLHDSRMSDTGLRQHPSFHSYLSPLDCIDNLEV